VPPLAAAVVGRGAESSLVREDDPTRDLLLEEEGVIVGAAEDTGADRALR
jgi:hypothetical protein